MLPVSAVLTLKEVQVCVGDVDHKSIGVQTASVFLKKKEGGTEEGGRKRKADCHFEIQEEAKPLPLPHSYKTYLRENRTLC